MVTMLWPLKTTSAKPAWLWLVVLCIFLGGCNEGARKEALPTRTEGGEMVTLGIDLQDRFENDTVVMRMNGEEVFRKEHITTNLLLGLADSFKTEVEQGSVRIEISIETRNIVETIPMDVSADTYLGISVVSGRIEYIILDEPFGYG